MFSIILNLSLKCLNILKLISVIGKGYNLAKLIYFKILTNIDSF